MASGFSYTEACALPPDQLTMWIVARSATERDNYDADFDYRRMEWPKKE